MLIAAAALLLTTPTATTPWAVLLTAYVLLGIGFGLVNTPITSSATSGMPRAQAGVSAAITTTGRQVGNSLGVAVLGSIFAARAHGQGPAAFTAASHLGWWVLIGCGVLVAVLGVLTTTRHAEASAARVAAAFPDGHTAPDDARLGKAITRA